LGHDGTRRMRDLTPLERDQSNGKSGVRVKCKARLRMTLSQLCITAATQYRTYLDRTKGGCETISVELKQQEGESQWKLQLSKSVFNPDCVELQISGMEVSRDLYRVVSVDWLRKEIVLEFTQAHPAFEGASAKSIRLVSDLKHLVDNVRRWYEEHGETIEMPEQGGGLRVSHMIPLRPADQRPAVETVLASPLSYVFGPPGTGKTRHVLASAVISHLDGGQVVLILAPTNNALDVAMRGVIEACRNAGRDISKFLRLGTPSADFARDFPRQCEARGVAARLAVLRQEIRGLEEEMRWRRAADDLPRLDGFIERLQNVISLGHERDTALRELGSLQLAGRRSLEWEKRARDIDREIQDTRAWVDQNRGYLSQDGQRPLADLSNWDLIAQAIQELTGLRHAALNVVLGVRPLREIEAELAEQLAHENELLNLTLERRLTTVQVIGLTWDRYIGDCHDKIPHVHHIFIDEAAFTPLIKALVVFAKGAPVTLLGDHKQLPPVCEMDDDKEGFRFEDYESCIVWGKSALFCEKALTVRRQVANMSAKLLKAGSRPKSFGEMQTASLKFSYRFGPGLAALLSELVYGRHRLRSAGPSTLIVEVLHAAREPNGDKCNIAQAARVVAIARGLGQESWAILTPYRNQRDQIKNGLNHRLADRVLTVHGSQGQEWDTVIFCTADSNSKSLFLNNSTNPKGQACLNTALSRVKRRLILVLDRSFWENRYDRNRQLLSRLIALSRH